MEEITTIKEQWYDLTKYREEIASFVKSRRKELDITSKMSKNFDVLYRNIYAGSEVENVQRYPHATEVYKTYKTALISSCLSGYSALCVYNANDNHSILNIPKVKDALIKQFKKSTLIELLTFYLDDFILKGEQIAFVKCKTNEELYRTKETLIDAETNEPVAQFKMIKGLEYRNIEVERIDPLDFFVDAYDYIRDPRGCVKIIRSYITAKNILTSNEYPLLSKDEKQLIVDYSAKNGERIFSGIFDWKARDVRESITNQGNIEVLTFVGDYITSDNKVLSNITATVVGGFLANVKYNQVNTNRIIYAPYTIDKDTHRGISPIASCLPINNLINRACDMLLTALDNSCNPWILYAKGSLNAQQDMQSRRKKRELEYIDLTNKPEFYVPPFNGQLAMPFLETILQQSKNILGLNNYTTGDTSGAVRTARETAVINQNINSRQRIETDPYSYNFLLPLLNTYYSLNRELALVHDKPLDDIFMDESINIDISTNASRADKEGEMNRLTQMLQLPIAQMMFSNFTPEQNTLAIRYLLNKAEIGDVDNILQLKDSFGNTQFPTDVNNINTNKNVKNNDNNNNNM